jgi:hypothetical protein
MGVTFQEMVSPPNNIFEAMQLVIQGYQLQRSRLHGWGWHPSASLLDQWIERGEIG